MKNITINVLLFATGAAIGSLVTWKIMRDKRDQEIQSEVDSFKEYWREYVGEKPKDNVVNESADEEEEPDENFDQVSMFEYRTLANMYNQSGNDAENVREGERDDDVPYVNGPYVISPDDYGDSEYDHDLQSLTYYADGVLADDWDVKLDVDETIGEDSVNHFGEYQDGILHVRNERTRRDYEIAQDPRNYSDVAVGTDPSNSAYAD